jgi:copper chaperone CopZ
MKNLTIRLIAVTGLLVAAAGPAMAVESVKATVNGMVCAFCAQGIETRLSKMPATKAVFVDLRKKIVLVEAKEGQKLDGRLITAEITEAGYDVTKLETVSQSVADIKAESKVKK